MARSKNDEPVEPPTHSAWLIDEPTGVTDVHTTTPYEDAGYDEEEYLETELATRSAKEPGAPRKGAQPWAPPPSEAQTVKMSTVAPPADDEGPPAVRAVSPFQSMAAIAQILVATTAMLAGMGGLLLLLQ